MALMFTLIMGWNISGNNLGAGYWSSGSWQPVDGSACSQKCQSGIQGPGTSDYYSWGEEGEQYTFCISETVTRHT